MSWEYLSAWCVGLSLDVVLIAGVGMISLKSILARRVVRIVDGSRALSIRAGTRAIVATIVIGGLGTMAVGLVAVGGRPADAIASEASETEPPSPLGPTEVIGSPDGKTLYVVAADAKQILVVEADGGEVAGVIDLPTEPTGLVLGVDGATLYVTCAAPDGAVAVVDIESGEIRRLIRVGHWPIGPAISPDGRTLYVCNRFDNNVSVVDLRTKRITRVPTTREPYVAAVTPDGKSVFIANHLPNDRVDTFDVAAVVTVIDTATNRTETIRLPNGSTAMRGLCVSPDGNYVYATHQLARYEMPTTQVERGWMNTNVLSVIDARRKKLINTVLLDDVDLGAANPWGVDCTADGETLVVSHAGTHEVTIIDAPAMLEKLLALAEGEEVALGSHVATKAAHVRNDLAFLHGLRRRVPLGDGDLKVNGPRGLTVVGSKAFATGYFSDTLSVVDLEAEPGGEKSDGAVSTVALGPKPQMTVQRQGEMHFHDATLCLEHWQSCASCHPDARVDGLNWDLLTDGLGTPKNTRGMLLAHETGPSMSTGVVENAEMAVHRALAFQLFARDGREEAAAPILKYIESLRPVRSPHLVVGRFSLAAERGRKLFFSEEVNCARCHPKPLFTDRQMHDVGTRGKMDRHDEFDTPTLIECWRTAPYLHDGRYTTIQELLIKGKHGLGGDDGVTLTEQQCNDLAEYVLSLGESAE